MIADIEQIEAHRQALTGHCYRMLGSAVDADDATQETIIRAWKNADQFEGRAALLTWLYRIATNVCIAKLSDRRRRARPMEERAAGAPTDALVQHPRTHWIEPVPDARAIPADADPFERAVRAFNIFNHPQYVGGSLSDVVGVAFGAGTIAGDLARTSIEPTSANFAQWSQAFSSNPRQLQLSMKLTF
jgi:RNA polymerase sigma factor (sigma-70 family)